MNEYCESNSSHLSRSLIRLYERTRLKWAMFKIYRKLQLFNVSSCETRVSKIESSQSSVRCENEIKYLCFILTKCSKCFLYLIPMTHSHHKNISHISPWILCQGTTTFEATNGAAEKQLKIPMGALDFFSSSVWQQSTSGTITLELLKIVPWQAVHHLY